MATRDPLAGYTQGWREKIGQTDDPLEGYDPNWRQTLSASQDMANQLRLATPSLSATREAEANREAARAAELRARASVYEALPQNVRLGMSAARGAVDAFTLGHGKKAFRDTDEMMAAADRGVGEKAAGGAGYLFGTAPWAMLTGGLTQLGLRAAAGTGLASRVPGLARALTYLTETASAPSSAGRVAAREALRGGATREAAGAAGRAAGRGALAQGAAQNVVQGLGFSAATEPVRALPEGMSRAESVALNTGVGAAADALLPVVTGRFAPFARTPLRDGRRAINALPFRHPTTPRSSDVPATLFVPEPAPRGIETQGAPTQVEAALRRANEVAASARLAEDEAAIQASLAQRQALGEAPAAPRVLGPGPRVMPARATPPVVPVEAAPAPIGAPMERGRSRVSFDAEGRPLSESARAALEAPQSVGPEFDALGRPRTEPAQVPLRGEPQRGVVSLPREPSPGFVGRRLEPMSQAAAARRRADELAAPVPEPDVDVPLRSAAEIGQRRAVERTQPDRAAREAPGRSLLVPEPEPRAVALLDAQGRPIRRPVEAAPAPEPVPEVGTRTEAVDAPEPEVLDLSAARARRTVRAEPESNVVPAESPVGDAPLTLRDEAAGELASLPPRVRTIVENALGAETEQALFAEMSNLQGVRMTDQQAEIVNGLFARARERLAPKADAAPVAAATETPTAATLDAGGRRGSARASEVDRETLLGDMRALERARPAAEADPNVRVLEFHGEGAEAAQALRNAVQQAGAPERLFRIGPDEYVVLAPADRADAILGAARQGGLAGGAGNTLDEANAAMRRGMVEARSPQRAVAPAPEPGGRTPVRTILDENGEPFDPAAVRSDGPERPLRPAVRVGDTVHVGVPGEMHADVFARLGDDVIEQFHWDKGADIEDGYLTSRIRFVNKTEGFGLTGRKAEPGFDVLESREIMEFQSDAPRPAESPMGDRTPDVEPRAPEAQAVEPEAPREPLPETRRPDAAVESRPRAASIDGQETTVRNLAGKGEARVRYRAVEASNLQASHNASTFQKNPAYPEGVQPRQYERDKNLQESVARLAQEFDPRVVTSNTALATEGPPISTPDGITLSGNSRLMAMQRIYAQGGEAAGRLRQAMIDAGEQYGIPRAELEQMRQPIIDRELIDEGLDLTQRDVLRSVADRANVATTKADSPMSDAATRARRLTPQSQALRHMEQTIGPEQTPRDYLGTREGREFVEELVNEGVISRDELSRFVDSQGVLTSDGRDLVERVLLASAIDDADILARANENLASTVQGLTRAAPAILRARAVEGWNVQGALNEGLEIALEAKAKGVKLRDLLDQGTLLDDAQRSAHGTTMARFLDGSTPTEVKDAFRKYAREAEIARKKGEMDDLFGDKPKAPAEAFDEVFGAHERMAKSKRKPCQ